VLNRRRNPRKRGEGGTRRWLPKLPALPWRKLGVAAGTIGGLAAVLAGLLAFLNQPIERIDVEGRLAHITALDVQQAARARLGGAGLVSVRLDAVARAVRALPWVETVTVERRWPHGLAVRVGEQQAVARWNGAGFINAHGELFPSDPRFAAAELPQLGGPAGSEAEVVRRYLAVQGRVAESGMRLVALQQDARGAWTLSLDNGVSVRLGRKQVDERIARFTDVALRLVAQRARDIDYVDLRYTNGFAVGWRSTAGRTPGNAEDGKPNG
jgi:cell division protein FtsQ